jgi:hypothetical protein
MARLETIKCTVRLPQQEYEHLAEQSALAGVSRNTFMRSLIRGVDMKPRPPDAFTELVRELNHIGNNLNQLARAANADGYAGDAALAECRRLFEEMWRAVDERI